MDLNQSEINGSLSSERPLLFKQTEESFHKEKSLIEVVIVIIIIISLLLNKNSYPFDDLIILIQSNIKQINQILETTMKGYNFKSDLIFKINDKLITINKKEEHQFWYILDSVKIETQELVTLKVSKTDKISYELVKKESLMLQSLKVNLSSYVNYVDSIDIETENIYVLVLEHQTKSIADIIEEQRNSSSYYTEKELINIALSLFNSLFELHSQNVSLNNININTIAVDEKGNYKFRDYIHPSLAQEFHKQYDKSILIEQNLIKQEILQSTLPNTKRERKLQSDVYCLGLMLLQIIGIDFGFVSTEELVEREKFLKVQQQVRDEYFNLSSFVYLYMLNKDYQLRYFSLQLKKLIYKFYEGVYFSADEAKGSILSRIKIYQEKSYPVDCYYGYLACLLIQSDKSEANQELFSKAIASLQENNCIEIDGDHIMLLEIGNSYLRIQKYDQAIDYLSKSEQLKEKEGSFKQQYMSSINNIGNCFFYKKDYLKALSYYDIAHQKRSVYYNSDHALVADLERNRGLCFLYSDDLQSAVNSQLKALQIREKWFKGNHYLIAESCLDLGDCYQYLDNNAYAKVYNERALDMYQSLYQQSPNKQLSDALNNMGIYYYYERKYEESLDYFLKSLNAQEKVFGVNNIETVSTIRNVALSYFMIPKYVKSLEYYKRALEIKQNYYKVRNEEIANSLYDLADVYRVLGYTELEFITLNELLEVTTELKIDQPYYYQCMIQFIETISDEMSRLKHILYLWKKFKISAKSQRSFMKELLTLASSLYDQYDDHESSEHFKFQLVLDTANDVE